MTNKYSTYGNLAQKPERQRTNPLKPRQTGARGIKTQVNGALRRNVLVLCFVAAIAAMVVVYMQCCIANAGYKLDSIRHNLIKTKQANEQLQLDISRLKTPRRIQYIATTELGMVLPAKVFYAHKNQQ